MKRGRERAGAGAGGRTMEATTAAGVALLLRAVSASAAPTFDGTASVDGAYAYAHSRIEAASTAAGLVRSFPG